MKKVLLITVAAFLASCGSKETTSDEVVVPSDSVVVDSVAVEATVDSVAVEAVVDTLAK